MGSPEWHVDLLGEGLLGSLNHERFTGPAEVAILEESPFGVGFEELQQRTPLTGDLIGAPAVVVVKRHDHTVLQPREEKIEHGLRARIHVAVDIRKGDIHRRVGISEFGQRLVVEALDGAVGIAFHPVDAAYPVEGLNACRQAALLPVRMVVGWGGRLGQTAERIERPHSAFNLSGADLVERQTEGHPTVRTKLDVITAYPVVVKGLERLPEELPPNLPRGF